MAVLFQFAASLFQSEASAKSLPLLADVTSSAKGQSCLSCGQDITSTDVTFLCATQMHTLCQPCFIEYVHHCGEHYCEGKIPVVCPGPSCKAAVGDNELRRLLLPSPTAKSSTAASQPGLRAWETYLEASLKAGLLADRDLTVVGCPKCEAYHELAPRDYQQRAQRLRRQMLGLQPLTVGSAAKPTPAVAVHARSEPPAQRLIFEQAALAAQAKSAKQAAQQKKAQQKQQAEAAAQEEKKAQDAAQLSSTFFLCLAPGCGGARCLLCDKEVDGMRTMEHVCKQSRQDELYFALLDMLAENSVRRCPTCKKVGRKDLACTHISCDCGARWCYVCEKTELQVGNFGSHNSDWNLDCPKNRCPNVLQWRWGGVDLKQGRFNGDPNISLARFHISLQQAAVAAYKATLSADDMAAWEAMLQSRFPAGIWTEKEVADMNEIERIRLNWRSEAQLEELVAHLAECERQLNTAETVLAASVRHLAIINEQKAAAPKQELTLVQRIRQAKEAARNNVLTERALLVAAFESVPTEHERAEVGRTVERLTRQVAELIPRRAELTDKLRIRRAQVYAERAASARGPGASGSVSSPTAGVPSTLSSTPGSVASLSSSSTIPSVPALAVAAAPLISVASSSSSSSSLAALSSALSVSAAASGAWHLALPSSSPSVSTAGRAV